MNIDSDPCHAALDLASTAEHNTQNGNSWQLTLDDEEINEFWMMSFMLLVQKLFLNGVVS